VVLTSRKVEAVKNDNSVLLAAELGLAAKLDDALRLGLSRLFNDDAVQDVTFTPQLHVVILRFVPKALDSLRR
jgi:hypothetical protein